MPVFHITQPSTSCASDISHPSISVAPLAVPANMPTYLFFYEDILNDISLQSPPGYHQPMTIFHAFERLKHFLPLTKRITFLPGTLSIPELLLLYLWPLASPWTPWRQSFEIWLIPSPPTNTQHIIGYLDLIHFHPTFHCGGPECQEEPFVCKKKPWTLMSRGIMRLEHHSKGIKVAY